MTCCVDYAVEVSSPGPERPLTKLDHYRRFLGRRVRVRTREAIEGRKDFKGELVGADDEASRSPGTGAPSASRTSASGAPT